MDYALLLSLIGFTAAGALTPGPNNLLLMSQGLRFGFKACLPYIFGVAAGFGALLIALSLGLGVVIETFPWLLPIISVIGALWLAWLAWGFVKAAYAPPKIIQVFEDNPAPSSETSKEFGRDKPIGFSKPHCSSG